MGLLRRNALLALSSAIVVLVLAGCGGADDPGLIPSDDAAGLLELLDEAQGRFDDGSCDELESSLTELDRAADRIPDAEVDQRLRTTLNAEILELGEMAARCRPSEVEVAPEPVPAPVPAPAPPVVPETTPPAPVEPTTTEETPPEEEPAEDEQPAEDTPPESPAPENPPNQKPPGPPPSDPCANDAPRC